MNFEQQLLRKANRRVHDMNSDVVLNEAQKLLTDSGQEDLNMLLLLSSNSVLSNNMKEKSKILELENDRRYYDGAILTENEICELGAKYRLKFLTSQLFTGNIETKVIPAIRELERAIGKSMTEKRAAAENFASVEEYITKNGRVDFKFDAGSLKTRFFILAPSKMFKTVKTQKFHYDLPDLDPILFYEIEAGEYATDTIDLPGDKKVQVRRIIKPAKYRLVKKWGADFGIGRAIKAFFYKTDLRYRFFLLLIPICGLLGLISYFTTKQSFTWWSLMGLICCLTLICLTAGKFDPRAFGEAYVTSDREF